MSIETVKQLCTANAVVTTDSLVEQVAQIEDFGTSRVDGREFFRRNYSPTDSTGWFGGNSIGLPAGRRTARSISPRPWAEARRIA